MASLKHVCMWTNRGWKHITAEEAAKLHPGGRVSAHSGLFICDLCGQYVLLTNGKSQVRSFRHSSSEESKECPERTFGSGYSCNCKPEEHELPIRIIVDTSKMFSFELGLIRAPISSLSENFCIKIQPKGLDRRSTIFFKERLNDNSITYLPIGKEPYESYTLSFQNGSKELHDFWPTETTGIDSQGTLFEYTTGKKLLRNSDVEIRKEYYLLKHGELNCNDLRGGVQIKKITTASFSGNIWNLYSVLADGFNEKVAKFFLNYHCRLTERPVMLKPVWPLFIEDSFVIKHNEKSMFMFAAGDNLSVESFPGESSPKVLHETSQFKLYKVCCTGRQQLISAQRTKTLQYTYFWKEALEHEGENPQISVTDITGAEVISGETEIIPKDNILRFKSFFDGELIIINNNHVIEKIKLEADKLLEVNNLSFDLSIQLVVGCDCFWKVEFKRKQEIIEFNEKKILRYIICRDGVNIPIPHSLSNILIGMKHHSKIYFWIMTCIKQGKINRQSYRRLQDVYRNMYLNR